MPLVPTLMVHTHALATADILEMDLTALTSMNALIVH